MARDEERDGVIGEFGELVGVVLCDVGGGEFEGADVAGDFGEGEGGGACGIRQAGEFLLAEPG